MLPPALAGLAVISPGFTSASAVHGLIGGVLIGIASAIMLLGLGRIAGVSGIAARATRIADSGPPLATSWAFLAGLPLGAGLLAAGGLVQPAPLPQLALLLAAGLLVGLGTRMGSGCTSGHGVCGTSRLSPRSIAATLTFVAAGIGTVAAMRLLGL